MGTTSVMYLVSRPVLHKRLQLCLETIFVCSFLSLYPSNFRSLDIDIVNFDPSIYIHKTEPIAGDYRSPVKMTDELWQYLRTGLNYLEASGQNLPPEYVHPGGVAFGPLGLSEVAAEDVLQRFPSMPRFDMDEIFSDPGVYENFAKCYADLLLRHYLGLDYWNMDKRQVFDILQRAWFLGPNLYRQGASIIASRERRAREFLGTHQNPVM